jgi:hypothetical protein
MKRKLKLIPVLSVFILITVFSLPVYSAPNFANDKFKGLWEYSDKRVDEIPGAGRGFTWGPNSFGIYQEDYQEGPGGKRQVQYFDKSRMELSPDGSFVTNGLLTKELVTGNRQDGNAKFTQLQPSTVQIAGDPVEAGNTISPNYASFKGVVSFNPGENYNQNKTGQIANQALSKDGIVTTLDNVPATVTLGLYQEVFGHNVPQVFVDFQNLPGLIWYAPGQSYQLQKVYTDNPTANVFGYAISEAFWIKTVVGGLQKDVLVQLFERRVLTYTPSNPLEFRVEMGNIGQHYQQWRYSQQQQPPPIATTTTAAPVVTTAVPTTTVAPINVPAANCLPQITTNQTLVQACVSNPTPSKNSNQTVYGRLIVNGQVIKNVPMYTTWYYKTTTPTCEGNSGSSGVASCTRNIGGASSGYEVDIDVRFSYNGLSYYGSTSFTTK